jgi:DNA-binding transcriptional LysR family regulator
MHSKELPNLETFAEAAERGSFTGAARSLGISQAAVSQRIQLLEVALGVSLFHREAGRVTLSEAGRRLHGYARRILDLTAEAAEAVTGMPGEVSGELRIAASSVPGQHLLSPPLALFRKRHPLVQVRVSVSDTEGVIHELEHGEAQLGLVGDQPSRPQLEYRRFASDELALVVPRRHPWWNKSRVTAGELASQPLIQREMGSGTRRCLERSLEHAGIHASELNVVLELGSNEAVKEAVLAGLGVAVLSRHAVRREVEAGQLRTVRVSRLPLERDIFVVRDRRRALSTPANLFLHLLEPKSASRN